MKYLDWTLNDPGAMGMMSLWFLISTRAAEQGRCLTIDTVDVRSEDGEKDGQPMCVYTFQAPISSTMFIYVRLLVIFHFFCPSKIDQPVLME